MKVATTRFGSLEVLEADLFYFPSGILGFPDYRRYVLLDHDTATPLKWLQAMDDGKIVFPVVPPALVLLDYKITAAPEDLAALGLADGDEALTYVILTIPKGRPEQTTANLRAPILINPITRVARQVLAADDYPIRYPLPIARPADVECAG